jgi:hypothetical protein
MVTPVAVAVAADEITTVVAFVTEAMVAPAGMPAQVMNEPTSSATNAAVALVTVVFVLVARVRGRLHSRRVRQRRRRRHVRAMRDGGECSRRGTRVIDTVCRQSAWAGFRGRSDLLF